MEIVWYGTARPSFHGLLRISISAMLLSANETVEKPHLRSVSGVVVGIANFADQENVLPPIAPAPSQYDVAQNKPSREPSIHYLASYRLCFKSITEGDFFYSLNVSVERRRLWTAPRSAFERSRRPPR